MGEHNMNIFEKVQALEDMNLTTRQLWDVAWPLTERLNELKKEMATIEEQLNPCQSVLISRANKIKEKIGSTYYNVEDYNIFCEIETSSCTKDEICFGHIPQYEDYIEDVQIITIEDLDNPDNIDKENFKTEREKEFDAPTQYDNPIYQRYAENYGWWEQHGTYANPFVLNEEQRNIVEQYKQERLAIDPEWECDEEDARYSEN